VTCRLQAPSSSLIIIGRWQSISAILVEQRPSLTGYHHTPWSDTIIRRQAAMEGCPHTRVAPREARHHLPRVAPREVHRHVLRAAAKEWHHHRWAAATRHRVRHQQGREVGRERDHSWERFIESMEVTTSGGRRRGTTTAPPEEKEDIVGSVTMINGVMLRALMG
jgi:hypothetical protein